MSQQPIAFIKRHAAALARSRRHCFLLIFTAAVVLRVAYVSTLEDKWYYYDTVHYDKAARAILDGQGFGSGYRFSSLGMDQEYSLEPTYPVFLAAVYGTFGPDLLVVRLIQCLLGGLTCWLIYCIGTLVFDHRSGLIAAGLGAIFPLHIFIAGLLYPTAIITVSLAAGIYFVLRSQRGAGLVDPLLAGLFLGIATLSLPIIMALYPFLALWLVAVVKVPPARRIRLVVLTFAALFVTLVPWTVRNYQIFHKIVPIRAAVGDELFKVKVHVASGMQVDPYRDETNGAGPSIDDYAWVKEEMKTRGFLGNVMNIVFAEPVKFIRRYSMEFLHFWKLYPDRVRTGNKFSNDRTKILSIMSFGPILLFGIIGIGVSYRDFRRISLLFLMILAFSMAYSFFMTQMRYRIPIEPFIIVFSGHGLSVAWQAVQRRLRPAAYQS